MKNPFRETVDESLFLFIPGISDEQAEYAAHAINWHDNLVADNKRLRDALQRIGTGGYGPDAGKAISAIVSAALLDEKTS